MRNFDEERTQKVIGFFCEILIDNSCTVVSIRGKEIDWEFTSRNRHFKKLIGREVESYKDLNSKELRQAEKLGRKWGKRWQRKALKRYVSDIEGSSTEEKLKLMEDIKAELKDKEDSELKTLVNKV